MFSAPQRPDERPVGKPGVESPTASASEIPQDAKHDPAAVQPEDPETGEFRNQLEQARRVFAMERDLAEALRQLAEANVKITEAQLALAEKEVEDLKAENERLRQEIEALRAG
jgi:hypothetical protein